MVLALQVSKNSLQFSALTQLLVNADLAYADSSSRVTNNLNQLGRKRTLGALCLLHDATQLCRHWPDCQQSQLPWNAALSSASKQNNGECPLTTLRSEGTCCASPMLGTVGNSNDDDKLWLHIIKGLVGRDKPPWQIAQNMPENTMGVHRQSSKAPTSGQQEKHKHRTLGAGPGWIAQCSVKIKMGVGRCSEGERTPTTDVRQCWETKDIKRDTSALCSSCR